MRRILGAAIGVLSLAGAAIAQEVPKSQYVGENATGGKVYDEGYLACDNSTCKIGNDAQDWNTRPGLASTGQDVTITGGVLGNAVSIDAGGKLIDGGVPPGGAGGATTIEITEQPGGVLIESDTGGDDTMAIATGTNAGAMAPDDFTKLQGVADGAKPGDVVGPTSPVDDNLAAFDTTTGKLIQDSGAAVSDFATAAQGATADTAFQTTGDTGGLDDPAPDSVTTTWTGVATLYTRIKATVTSSAGLVISPPNGTVGTGVVRKILAVTNTSGGAVAVSFHTSFSLPADYVTGNTIADGETREYVISTDDTGIIWRLESGYLDLTTLPTLTLAVEDVLLGQDESATPDTWGSFTIQALITFIEGLLSIDGDQVTYTTRTLTDTGEFVLADIGKIVLCNKATAMTLQLDTDGISWPTDGGNVIYVENIGAGACTIAGGGTTAMTVHNPFPTAVLSQHQRATIRIKSDTVVSVGGGFDAS